MLELFTLASVLCYLALSDFSPFLQKFYIVLLRLLLDHFVVLVHLAHQLNVALMHVFHVLLYFCDVRLGKFYGHKISDTVLQRKAVTVQAIFVLVLIAVAVRIVVVLLV